MGKSQNSVNETGIVNDVPALAGLSSNSSGKPSGISGRRRTPVPGESGNPDTQSSTTPEQTPVALSVYAVSATQQMDMLQYC